jgi:hypothetical protein
VLPHLSADVRENLVPVLDLDGPVFLRHVLRDPGLRSNLV